MENEVPLYNCSIFGSVVLKCTKKKRQIRASVPLFFVCSYTSDALFFFLLLFALTELYSSVAVRSNRTGDSATAPSTPFSLPLHLLRLIPLHFFVMGLSLFSGGSHCHDVTMSFCKYADSYFCSQASQEW